MSKFSYSFTMRISKLLPCVVDPGPNILNSALVEPPLVMLPPLNLIIPCEKSLFDWLLERQKNERIGNWREFDYVTVMVMRTHTLWTRILDTPWTPAIFPSIFRCISDQYLTISTFSGLF